jgi:hypothetical protein
VATRAGRQPRCPICRGKLPEQEESPERGPKFAPLCSLRCKRIDLATWLGEGYRISGEPAEQNDDDQSGDER